MHEIHIKPDEHTPLDSVCQAYLQAKRKRSNILFDRTAKEKADEEIKLTRLQVKEEWKREFPNLPGLQTIRIINETDEVFLICYATPGTFGV